MSTQFMTRDELLALLFKGQTTQLGDTEYYEVKDHYVHAICKKCEIKRNTLSSTVVIITDGACRENGKPNSCGGWGAILMTEVNGKVIALVGEGSIPGATNNTAELIAVREGFRMLRSTIPLAHVLCDSTYAIGALDGTNKRRKNTQLIADIEKEVKSKATTIEWKHNRGHTGFKPNELVDVIAKENAGSKY